MKIAKVAAGVAGAALALGVASPALAAPAAGIDNLVDSSTVSKNEVKNPLKDINADVLIGGLSKVADKLATKNDLASKTNALGGAATR
ncbi:hypothetical protein [Streptomyces gilvosporeus]|uniref:hypothetical protein n=1 Tax=Streptomyces gilvosporeus TaxID=553510 RepID=UPI00131D7B7D|nr:hypothetical protein [Streptomyces gilvosporeus]